jgi:membrane-bound lytic murein transglycosylase MltF
MLTSVKLNNQNIMIIVQSGNITHKKLLKYEIYPSIQFPINPRAKSKNILHRVTLSIISTKCEDDSEYDDQYDLLFYSL